MVGDHLGRSFNRPIALNSGLFVSVYWSSCFGRRPGGLLIDIFVLVGGNPQLCRRGLVILPFFADSISGVRLPWPTLVWG